MSIRQKVLIFGDMHFSDSFKGTHINYMDSGRRLMARTIEIVKEEKPERVVFAGDFLGVQEKNVRLREFFIEIVKFLQELNKLTNNEVYIVKGNHDIDGYSVTDTEMLIELGLFKHQPNIDLGEGSNVAARIHLVDFSFEDDPIDFADGAKNIVVGHNDFAFNPMGLFSQRSNGVILSNHLVWEGVDLILSGHIHVPSTEVIDGRIGNSASSLFVLGAPSRVAERVPDVYYVSIGLQGGGTSDEVAFEANLFGLWSVEEEFLPKENREDLKEDDELALMRTKELRVIIQELTDDRLLRGSLESQIEKFPLVSSEVKEKATEYLRKAISRL